MAGRTGGLGEQNAPADAIVVGVGMYVSERCRLLPEGLDGLLPSAPGSRPGTDPCSGPGTGLGAGLQVRREDDVRCRGQCLFEASVGGFSPLLRQNDVDGDDGGLMRGDGSQPLGEGVTELQQAPEGFETGLINRENDRLRRTGWRRVEAQKKVIGRAVDLGPDGAPPSENS